MKRPRVQVPPIRKEDGTWARSEQEKAEIYARHLERVFLLNAIDSELDIVQCPQLSTTRKKIKNFTPLEVAKVIDDSLNPKKSPGYNKISPKILKELIDSELNIVQCPQLSTTRKKIKNFTTLEVATVIDDSSNPKKAPGYDEISPKILKELPKKAIIHFTHIYNAILRMEYIPEQWKRAQVILLLKSVKPPEDVTSYRPISLLPSLSKLLEKLLLKRLKPIIEEKHLIRTISLDSVTNIRKSIKSIALLT
ncbi:Hypothetical protein CINCED_3A023579 [Cinara cedri]|uniref:Reverse transcriptase domain n=1 Tax=Cinara cedri TaxID=506608 RepID=A0A5E4MH94_9HEMI|nr:Hypothetical protein CINCED_3A023579 [Cinara cedri]